MPARASAARRNPVGKPAATPEAKPKPPVAPISPGVKITGSSAAIVKIEASIAAREQGATQKVHCLQETEVSINSLKFKVPAGEVVVPAAVAAILKDTGKAV